MQPNGHTVATRTILLPALTALGWLAGCATPGQVQKQSVDEFNALTRDAIGTCATVKDDRLETSVTFTTLNCYQRKNGILKIVWDDNFLRAFKNKTTGAITFQVYTVLYYKDWLFPHMANFGVDTVQSVPGERIGSDVDCSQKSLYGHCMHQEQFVFELPLDEITRIERKRAEHSGPMEWKYRLKTKAGVDADRILNADEILGLFDVVTRYDVQQTAAR